MAKRKRLWKYMSVAEQDEAQKKQETRACTTRGKAQQDQDKMWLKMSPT